MSGPRRGCPPCSSASPRRAVVRSVFFGPLPPIRIGRWAWIGRGSQIASWSCVERALVAEALPVEQPAEQHDRLVEAIEALPESRPEVDAEGVVLPLEPGAADAEDGAAIRDVVEGRGELRGQAGVPERVRADHQPEAEAPRHGREGGEGRPALEDRLLGRPEDRQQVIPRPDGVPAEVVDPDRPRPGSPASRCAGSRVGRPRRIAPSSSGRRSSGPAVSIMRRGGRGRGGCESGTRCAAWVRNSARRSGSASS